MLENSLPTSQRKQCLPITKIAVVPRIIGNKYRRSWEVLSIKAEGTVICVYPLV
jgi:hypothetical protein